jgi:asparagine synthase (glutamine-hydrolysing)
VSGICGAWIQDERRALPPDGLDVLLDGLQDPQRSEAGRCGLDLGGVRLGAAGHRDRLFGAARTGGPGTTVAVAFHGALYDAPHGAASGADLAARLLEHYAREGIDFVARLAPECSLAIWDEEAGTLTVTTDPFRVHPIYYYDDPRCLVFGTHLRVVADAPVPKELSLDPAAIVDVVSGSVIHTPRSIYRRVRKLPPGHMLIQRSGELSVRPYWDLNFRNASRESEATLAERLREIFKDAVGHRLRADGDPERVGAFLSGGVDSTAVSGLVGTLTGRPANCFSIGFQESSFDELQYARVAARAIKAKHTEYIVTPQNACDAIPTLLEAFDEPYANASAIPTLYCARLARDNGVGVLYAGDGGDELFAGNERYASLRVFRHYERIPRIARERFLEPLVFALAARSPSTLLRKAKKYIERASLRPEERFFSYGFFHTVPIAEFLENSLLEAAGSDYDPLTEPRRLFAAAPANTELDRQLYADLHVAISDNDLIKVTRMTDAAGVEVRFPFLDTRLAAFAATVPADMKMRGGQLRTFFKRAYADLLPPEVRAKRKHGFALPIPTWLRTHPELREMMHDLVLGPRAVQRGFFRKRALEDLVDRHRTDTTSYYGTILWNLMVLELWQRRYR